MSSPEVRPSIPGRRVGDWPSLESRGFTDRVMDAIRRESLPTPTRTFLSAVRSLSTRDAAGALWVAWHLGTARAWPVAPGVRVRSMALVLSVACALGAG